jgi:ABC-2 type transport system permease protein
MNAMNTQTNAFPESRLGADAVAQPTINVTRLFYWSVRCELWENRSIYITPLAAAALVVLGTFFGAFHGKGNLLSPNAMQQRMIIEEQCSVTGLLIMGVTFIVAIFYCLDAFYGEQRDRSIFFWKSLPVSDTVTVLAKTSIPLLIIPVLTFAIAAVTQWIVLAIDAATLASHGRSLSVIGQVPVFEMQMGLIYHLVAVHALWYAPIFAWFLLVSAWARRVPLLWAFLPPLVIGVIEKIAFNTSHFAHYIGYRIGVGPSGGSSGSMDMHAHSVAGMTPGQFFASPGLWGGLLLAALFLAGAAQLRRYRAPS